MTFAPDSYAALADLSRAFTPPSPTQFDDHSLIEAQRSLAEIRRRADAAAAAIAGEIEHRSRRGLGYDGLAQRLGARTPEKLVETLTGLSARDARSLVRVGGMLDPDRSDTVSVPPAWLADVAAAVTAGRLGVQAAELIGSGLGSPGEHVTEAQLRSAAGELIREASAVPIDVLARRARQLRDDLDAAGVHDREQQRRDQRYLLVTRLDDGMVRLAALLDPESASVIVSALDAATSPRRGGPRFVDPTATERAERIVNDPRTTEQLAVDAFVELVAVAIKADDGTVLGCREPAVQVIVAARDLAHGTGVGFFEGGSDAVSIDTVERHVCEAGAVPILFDANRPLDVGRHQRLFTTRQRKALALRDGGCRFPDCDRPPSWTEAHHITEWRHGGRTDVADGILLCRHHHLLVHNNGWRIVRDHTDYFVRPPTSIDSRQKLLPMPSRSAAMRRFAAHTG